MTPLFYLILIIVFSQLKLAWSNKIGFEFEVYSSQSPPNIFPASIATVDAHNYVRLFFQNHTLVAQLYSMDGYPQSNTVIISSLTNLINPQLLVFEKDVGMIVTFIQNTSDINYYAQILSPDLTLVGDLITIASKVGSLAYPITLFLPIAEIETGIAIAFPIPTEPQGISVAIFAVIYDYKGNNITSQIQINNLNHISAYVSISTINNGSDLAFAYQTSDPSGSIYAAMLDKDGKTIKFQDSPVGSSASLPVAIGMNLEVGMVVIFTNIADGVWNINAAILESNGKLNRSINLEKSLDDFPGMVTAVTANRPQDKYILAYMASLTNVSAFILDKNLNILGRKSELITLSPIINFQISAMVSNLGFIISFTQETTSFGQMFSYCPQYLYWENSSCLSINEYPSNETNSSLYHFYCPTNGNFGENFCCAQNCMACDNEDCKCAVNHTANFSNDSCIFCGPEVETCYINNSQLVPQSCYKFYHLESEACCPLESTSCHFENNTIIVTNCSYPYSPSNDFCCPPGSQDCYIDDSGNIISTQCNNSFVLVNNNTCCPPDVVTCSLDETGDIIVTCVENFQNFGDLCCPPFSTSCSLNDNATVTADTCDQPYQPMDQICCPPDALSCQLDSNNELFNITCILNYNSIGGLCCPPAANSCFINGSGVLVAKTCNETYDNLVDGLCCPPEAIYCQIDAAGSIIPMNCSNSYFIYQNICCPPKSESCQLAENGSLIINSCDTNYSLINNVCCPPHALSCKLDNNGTIVVNQCETGYFIGIHGLCKSCQSNCFECISRNLTTNKDICLSCDADYFLFENTCVQPCPQGLHPTNNSWCCPLNCLSCKNGSHNCTSCSPGYFVSKETCVDQCPMHYLPNNEGICRSILAMCTLVCDVTYLCSDGFFKQDCEIGRPILDVVAGISIILSFLKLYFLLRAKQKTILIKLLLHHAYSDMMVCFIIFIIFDPSLIAGIHFESAVVFYGNLLGCAFTLEIFLCGFVKMYGSLFFEKNINKIIIGTYILCLGLGIIDFYMMKDIKQSPYLLIGIGGVAILVLDCIMALKIRKSHVKIDIRYLIVFPSILAITWGLASVPLFGVSLSSFFFWISFLASFLNYSQPIFNSLLYGPVIIRAIKSPLVIPESEMELDPKSSINSEISLRGSLMEAFNE